MLLIAASKGASFPWDTIFVVTGVIVALVTLGIAALYAVRYVAATSVKAQLDAKDSVIATNEQTIQALEKRTQGFQDQIVDLSARLNSADNQLRDLVSKVKEQAQQITVLEQFTAPTALAGLQKIIEDGNAKITSADKRLGELAQLSKDQARQISILEEAAPTLAGLNSKIDDGTAKILAALKANGR